MRPSSSVDGVDFVIDLPLGDTITLRFREIRRERTGVHALVALFYQQTILSHDTFNIGRGEDRMRLANRAHKALPGEVVKDAVSATQLNHYLDIASLEVPRLWEIERIPIIQYTENDIPEPVTFAIKPYILKGGGTVFFGPPGAGKTYLMQSMALAISAGKSDVWDVGSSCPVLYVNLERDGNSLLRREMALRRAMGIPKPEVYYLHARGLSLAALQRKLRDWLMDRGETGIMLDSISRSGNGSLVEDESANRFVDLMNGLPALWWAAIGHTPRATSEHLFGSVHFDAGMDVGVRVKTEPRLTSVGIALEITKANDIGHYTPQYLALEFGAPDSPLESIRLATDTEFPELSADKKAGPVEQMIAIIDQKGGRAMPTEISDGTRLSPSRVSDLLKRKEFVFLEQVGRNRFYGVASDA